MTAIIDYDAGNIKSVEKALLALGEEAIITRDPKVLLEADHVILPGVGSFGDAMDKLCHYGLVETIKQIVQKGTPFLGICLGLQLLFEESEESKGVKGLGLLKGKILRIPDGPGLKIPHIGWNSLKFPHKGRLFLGLPEESYLEHDGRLFRGIEENAYVYFVHSYYLKAAEEEIVTATTEYGTLIHASVEKNNIFGCQFHPEKSSEVGLTILKNFIAL